MCSRLRVKRNGVLFTTGGGEPERLRSSVALHSRQDTQIAYAKRGARVFGKQQQSFNKL